MRYKDSLYRFIYLKMYEKSEVDDLFSDSWVKFYKYAKKTKIEMKSVKSLLFTIAHNLIRDYYRRRKVIQFIFPWEKKHREEDGSDDWDFYTDLDSSHWVKDLEDKELVSWVNEGIKTLPQEQKEAFYLRFIEGFSFKEVSEIQKVSINTILSRVRYATEKIKNILSEKGVMSYE